MFSLPYVLMTANMVEVTYSGRILGSLSVMLIVTSRVCGKSYEWLFNESIRTKILILIIAFLFVIIIEFREQ